MSIFERKRKMHPIFKEAVELAHHGLEPIEFDDDAIEELKQSLAQWVGHPDLIDAVVELIELAYYLDKNGSPTASRKIVEVVRTITDPLENLAKNN